MVAWGYVCAGKFYIYYVLNIWRTCDEIFAVEISIKPVSLAKEFQGVLKLQDPDLIEEIAQSDELI